MATKTSIVFSTRPNAGPAVKTFITASKTPFCDLSDHELAVI
jgi:hypothetical protein